MKLVVVVALDVEDNEDTTVIQSVIRQCIDTVHEQYPTAVLEAHVAIKDVAERWLAPIRKDSTGG